MRLIGRAVVAEQIKGRGGLGDCLPRRKGHVVSAWHRQITHTRGQGTSPLHSSILARPLVNHCYHVKNNLDQYPKFLIYFNTIVHIHFYAPSRWDVVRLLH